jgi:purine-binding chemotaxis protein CheW
MSGGNGQQKSAWLRGTRGALEDLQRRLAILAGDDGATDLVSQQEILSKRAAQLARGTADAAAGSLIKLVVFRVGSEQFAVDIKSIGEIVPMRTLTVVPGVPAFVLGVISQRGNILSVIDVATFLHDAPPQRDRSLAIVFEHTSVSLGVAVDEILDIRSYANDAVQPAPMQQNERQRRFYEGILEGQIVLLKILDLISAEEVIVDQD